MLGFLEAIQATVRQERIRNIPNFKPTFMLMLLLIFVFLLVLFSLLSKLDKAIAQEQHELNETFVREERRKKRLDALYGRDE